METDFQQKPQMNSGLTRYRSAPSSYFSSLTDREFCDQFFNRPSSPETERIFARFMTGHGDNGAGGGGGQEDSSQNMDEDQKNNITAREVVFVPTESNQETPYVSNVNNYPAVSSKPSFYQSSMKPPLPNSSMISGKDGSSSMGVDLLPRMRTDGVRNSNLIRQNSSPAGLFNQIHIDGGFAALGGKRNFNEEAASFSSARRLKNFPSRTGPPHSSGLTPVAEIENQSVKENNPDNRSFVESHTNDYTTSFPVGSWDHDESAVMSDNVVSQKMLDLEDNDEDEKTYSNFNLSDAKKMDPGNRPPTLAHHLSMPNTSAEMSAIEKILQFSDSIPCKLRAKRGCATHPRSIAERVRRTKISERMRKLQELVPNMDKQTNTSDMLDLAVEYIKDLQKQVQTLSDNRAKCKCSHGRQQ